MRRGAVKKRQHDWPHGMGKDFTAGFGSQYLFCDKTFPEEMQHTHTHTPTHPR